MYKGSRGKLITVVTRQKLVECFFLFTIGLQLSIKEPLIMCLGSTQYLTQVTYTELLQYARHGERLSPGQFPTAALEGDNHVISLL